MSFDIRNYIWNIFEISKAQDTNNIKLSLDMFITNMELSRERYEGASSLDYKKLHNDWANLGNNGQSIQRDIFNKVMYNVYVALCDAWRAKDRRKFDLLCFAELD